MIFVFSLKEAFLRPFAVISEKISCEDLLPLYPVPSSPAFSLLHVPTSISYFKVLVCFLEFTILALKLICILPVIFCIQLSGRKAHLHVFDFVAFFMH